MILDQGASGDSRAWNMLFRCLLQYLCFVMIPDPRKELGSSVLICVIGNSPFSTKSTTIVFSSKVPGSNASRGCSCTNCKASRLIKKANLMLLCGFYTCTSEILQISLPGDSQGVSEVLDQLWFAEACSPFAASLTNWKWASFSITQMATWRLIICSREAEVG